MKGARMLLQGLLHPPGWALALIPAASFPALGMVFACQETKNTLTYLIYGMSAYSLAIIVAALLRLTKRKKSAIISRKRVRRATVAKFAGRYLGDPSFRESVGIYQGLAVNLAYCVFRIAAAARCASVWFFAMAAYYFVLGGLRLYLIVGYRRKNPAGERRCYRTAAWLLLLLNIPMGGMIVLMVRADAAFSYPGHIIYLSALYAFYAMAAAAVKLVKHRKLSSPILSAEKAVNFVAAMMSILGLQTALLSRFSDNGDGYRRMMNAITGGAVCGSAVLIAVCMLTHDRRLKRRAKAVE